MYIKLIIFLVLVCWFQLVIAGFNAPSRTQKLAILCRNEPRCSCQCRNQRGLGVSTTPKGPHASEVLKGPQRFSRDEVFVLFEGKIKVGS